MLIALVALFSSHFAQAQTVDEIKNCGRGKRKPSHPYLTGSQYNYAVKDNKVELPGKKPWEVPDVIS